MSRSSASASHWGRGDAARGIHPHVERAVHPEREAARTFVDLRRTDAQIEQHTGHPSDAARIQCSVQVREAVMLNSEAGILYGARFGDCCRVLVESDQSSAGPQPLQEEPAVPAPPEGSVDIDAVIAPQQRVDRLVSQHRLMA